MERGFSAHERKNVTAEVQTPHLCKTTKVDRPPNARGLGFGLRC